MRKIIYASLIVVIGIALGACAERTPAGPEEPQATSTTAPSSTPKASVPTLSPTETPAPQATNPPAPSDFTQFAIDPIREFLASELNLPLEQITLASWQAVTWRDSCLGVHKPKEGCLTVITPGFSLTFQAGSATAVVNTDATGKNFRLAEKAESPGPLPALSWTRTGGFAGICQNLNVYSMGTYWLRDCIADKILAQGVLSGQQQTYLNELFEQYGSFEWKTMPPAGSADMFIDQIRFYGNGSQVMPEEAQQKLNDYLAQLAGELESQSGGSTDAGIIGQVFIGPTCGGPIGPDTSTECADKPYAASITVLDPAGKVVTLFMTDAGGRFRVPLQPGAYTLHPESSGVMPAAVDMPIQVTSGLFLTVTITYDSGIR